MLATRLTLSTFFVAATVLASAVIADAGPPAVLYELRDGDTLNGIAARFRVPAREIARLNNIRNPNLIRGAGLLLPEVASTRSLPRYVPWATARQPARCASKPWTPMRAIEKSACWKPACSQGPSGQRACVCDDILTLTLPLAASVRVPLDRSGFEPLDVQLADVDLDSDERAETVISSYLTTSNGIGQVYRRLVVLKDGRELLRYDSGELTAQTAVVAHQGSCHLASSHYETVRHPLRGPALYLVERSFDPVSLSMDAEIAGQRVAETDRLRVPFDPLDVSPRPGAVEGTVLKVEGDLGSLEVRTARGIERMTFADDDYQRLRLGDARTGRVYPLDFTIPLVGRRVKVRRYAGWHVAWLAAP